MRIAAFTAVGLPLARAASTCVLLALCSCSTVPPPQRVRGPAPSKPVLRALPVPPAPPAKLAPVVPVSPFADSSVSFLVKGEFTRGEQVLVLVCLRPDRSIASSEILESSGDRRFDELAVDWARRVKLREAPAEGRPMASCGAVRVELRNASEPPVVPGSDNLLG